MAAAEEEMLASDIGTRLNFRLLNDSLRYINRGTSCVARLAGLKDFSYIIYSG